MCLPILNTIIISRLCLLLALPFIASAALAHGEKMHHDMTSPDSLAISVKFDQTGRLWRVKLNQGFVEVSHSTDLAKVFSTPVRVNPDGQKITAHGELRPKLAIGSQGEVYVTWLQNLPARFSGHIWFARSIDGGKHFEKPYVVHQDRAEISHAFEELTVSPDGKVTVVWLDARDAVKAMQEGKKASGGSVYYAISSDRGKTFQPEKKLADGSCECCRIAMTNKPDGTAVAMWRHVFTGNERDHMMAEIPSTASQSAVIKRATYGRWKIDGCPHHGAALASGGEGQDWWGYHMAWFDGGNDANGQSAGLYYARMDGVAWASSPAKKFAGSKNLAGHPALLSVGENVYLVWRESEAKTHKILGKYSDDGGRNWSEPKLLAETTGKADYPQLLNRDKQVYLAWQTAQEGLRLISWQ